MIDAERRLEDENLPSRNARGHWSWASKEALESWWKSALASKKGREANARQETLEVTEPAEDSQTPVPAEEPQREMGIEDMDNEIILVVSEDQQKLVAALIQRLDTPEVRFLMGQAPGADALYQKALTRGLVELGKELG
jgi:hypothetical protein